MREIAILTTAIVLAAVLGFSAHRAGLCMVKAVAEVMTSWRPFMLLAFAKTSAWSFLTILAVDWFGNGAWYQQWPLAWPGVAGGVVFGAGAAVNGGCVFSTLTRLADGRVGALAAVVMWPAGVLAATMLFGRYALPGLARSSDVVREMPWFLTAALSLWAVAEFWRISGAPLVAKARSGFARRPLTLSSAAVLIGLCNGFIYNYYQNWSFTSAVMRSVGGVGPRVDVAWLFLASAFSGMLLSSWLRGTFTWRVPRRADLVRHGTGGLAMGVGTAMIPGGNDALILYGVPSLSPHAFPAVLGILAGATLALSLMRWAGGDVPAVVCRSDICESG